MELVSIFSNYKEYKILYESAIDGFQMPIKRPTSGGQACDQEVAVLCTFHLERSNFFYLSALMVRTECSAY